MNWPNRLSLLRVGLVPLIVLMIIIGASWSMAWRWRCFWWAA